MSHSFKKYIALILLVLVELGPSVCFAAKPIYKCMARDLIKFQFEPCPGVGAAEQNIVQLKENSQFNSYTIDKPGLSNLLSDANPPTTITIPKGLDGQYRLKVLINDVPVECLIDTGASRLSLPQQIIKQLNVNLGPIIQVHTAAKVIDANELVISRIQVGPYEFKDVAALSIPSEQALLGMNVLELFELNQVENSMILKLKSAGP